MRHLSLFLLLTSSVALAEAPKLFDSDPICDSVADFKKELENARPIHNRYPRLRTAVNDQNKWFGAVTGEMTTICGADKKFAAYLLAKERGKLTGQCKPAEEAASYDQEMLDHSESALRQLKTKKEELLLKGVRGVTDSLPLVATRNIDMIDDYAGDIGEVPYAAYCELLWLYPTQYLVKLKVGRIEGCPNLPQFNQAAPEDKKDPALFPKLMNRFDLSIIYNTARRDKAAVAAKASRARYEACIAEHPELKATPILGGKASGQGQGVVMPTGKKPRKSSDITGTEEDKRKKSK